MNKEVEMDRAVVGVGLMEGLSARNGRRGYVAGVYHSYQYSTKEETEMNAPI